MQIGQDLNFDKRAIFYWSKLVTEQLSEGMMLRELKKTISINILDFKMFNEEERNIYQVRMEAKADVESKIASALEEGREMGREEGREEGKEEGEDRPQHHSKTAYFHLAEIYEKI